MACIGKITGSLAMPCGATGGARLAGAKLLNASDIASFTIAPSGDATITRVSDAVAYDITTANNSATLTVGIKSQDIMPGAYDVSFVFKGFQAENLYVSDSTPLGLVGATQRAELVVAVQFQSGRYAVIGLGAPLVCLETSYDSTGDGFTTFTYGVEDWQVGTTIHYISKQIMTRCLHQQNNKSKRKWQKN